MNAKEKMKLFRKIEDDKLAKSKSEAKSKTEAKAVKKEKKSKK